MLSRSRKTLHIPYHKATFQLLLNVRHLVTIAESRDTDLPVSLPRGKPSTISCSEWYRTPTGRVPVWRTPKLLIQLVSTPTFGEVTPNQKLDVAADDVRSERVACRFNARSFFGGRMFWDRPELFSACKMALMNHIALRLSLMSDAEVAAALRDMKPGDWFSAPARLRCKLDPRPARWVHKVRIRYRTRENTSHKRHSGAARVLACRDQRTVTPSTNQIDESRLGRSRPLGNSDATRKITERHLLALLASTLYALAETTIFHLVHRVFSLRRQTTAVDRSAQSTFAVHGGGTMSKKHVPHFRCHCRWHLSNLFGEWCQRRFRTVQAPRSMHELRLEPIARRCPACRADIVARKASCSLRAGDDAALDDHDASSKPDDHDDLYDPRIFFPSQAALNAARGCSVGVRESSGVSAFEHRWIWFQRQLLRCYADSDARPTFEKLTAREMSDGTYAVTAFKPNGEKPVLENVPPVPRRFLRPAFESQP